MLDVILIEPPYKTKYPPIGLMKLSTYFKGKGFNVTFSKGVPEQNILTIGLLYDIVCVTTLYTYEWDITIETINHAKHLLKDGGRIFVGGIAASAMPGKMQAETGIAPIVGVLDKPGMLGFDDDIVIDRLPLDYTLIPGLDTKTAYAVATRGCVKECSFCIVHRMEPGYRDYMDVQIPEAATNLVMLDNNVLASRRFDDIIRCISKLGVKEVDFNQGLDYKYVSQEKMTLLKDAGVKTVRFSIDDCLSLDLYSQAVSTSVSSGINKYITTMLYNHNDTPQDLYMRLNANVEISEVHDITINSFPMKYIPLTKTDRSHIGEHWNKKFIRAIQGMLCSARGMVSGKRSFFEHMWGKNTCEYMDVLWMPQDFIIYRRKYSKLHREIFPSEKRYFGENDMMPEFLDRFYNLSKAKLKQLKSQVADCKYEDGSDTEINGLLAYYRLNTPANEIPWSKSYKGER